MRARRTLVEWLGMGFERRLVRAVRGAAFRLRYRDLYDDTKQQARLLSFAPRLKDKSVAVVGNAQSLFEHDYGSLIDSHDIVLRFNKGFVTNPLKQGRQTDILSLAYGLSLQEIREHFGDAAVIWVTPLRELMAKDLLNNRHNVPCVPFSLWRELYVEMNGVRPSAGTITIKLLRTLFEPMKISLFGFDWKATKTFYHDKDERGWHDWQSEMQLVRRWISEDSRLSLHPRN